MVGKIETKKAGSLADVMTIHQQTLGLIDDVVVDIADGCASRCLMDNVAEVAR